MTSAYLLTATLFICSVSAFAQLQDISSSNAAGRDQEKPAWKLSFDPPADFVASDHSLRFLSPDDRMSFASPGERIDGTVCYTIRSYVVARDRKDSDSVHPAGYSTCQPSNRYRLRTTDKKFSLNH